MMPRRSERGDNIREERQIELRKWADVDLHMIVRPVAIWYDDKKRENVKIQEK